MNNINDFEEPTHYELLSGSTSADKRNKKLKSTSTHCWQEAVKTKPLKVLPGFESSDPKTLKQQFFFWPHQNKYFSDAG